MSMIELNKKAKPFNPCESVLGTELLFKVGRCRMIGSYYYLDQPSEKIGKDVLIKGGLPTENQLKNIGFKQYDAFLDQRYSRYKKEGSKDSVIVAYSNSEFDDMSRVAELAKYVGISEESEDRQRAVKHMAEIVIQGKVLVPEGDGWVLTWPVNHPAEPVAPAAPQWQANAVFPNAQVIWQHAAVPNNMAEQAAALVAQWDAEAAAQNNQGG
jgi:hypothetical protein